jgi:DNA-binding response OmpR family regulator
LLKKFGIIFMARILIVDDDNLVRWSLRERFILEGYTVDAAATTREALAEAGRNSSDLIIADLEVEGECGLEMLQVIKNMRPGARIIVLSALGMNEKQVSSRGWKPDEVLEKLFEIERVSLVVKKILHGVERVEG